ncbi:hypothetical protein [Microbulbifer guangxiensis]|uniref:hypothetical protein n=1 Tax=Microbulbifer guangxiensis TaxID=2904249 RepID=UPI001F270C36|nr:hypothetical protein [Microbulbifer guangxiensis]
MGKQVIFRRDARIGRGRSYLWLLLFVSAALSIPIFAMQLAGEIQWGFGDFLVMGALQFGLGSLCIFFLGKLDSRWRFPVIGAFILLFLWAWAELAVGVFTDLGQ